MFPILSTVYKILLFHIKSTVYKILLFPVLSKIYKILLFPILTEVYKFSCFLYCLNSIKTTNIVNKIRKAEYDNSLK